MVSLLSLRPRETIRYVCNSHVLSQGKRSKDVQPLHGAEKAETVSGDRSVQIEANVGVCMEIRW